MLACLGHAFLSSTKYSNKLFGTVLHVVSVVHYLQ